MPFGIHYRHFWQDAQVWDFSKPLPPALLTLGIVQTNSAVQAALVGWHRRFQRSEPLKWRTRSEILKPLSVSIVLT
jgi:hypothetical protein